MNIYDAIMKAADTIESKPNLYNFNTNEVTDCNTPHCMLGWIGVYLGMGSKQKRISFRHVQERLGLSEVGPLASLGWGISFNNDDGDWNDPKDAARFLRKFALRFKPKLVGIPDSIRAIFTNIPGEYVS